MTISEGDVNLLRLLAARLERLSADSQWAHRASGVRGQVLRMLDQFEGGKVVNPTLMEALIESGFSILRRAAMGVSR